MMHEHEGETLRLVHKNRSMLMDGAHGALKSRGPWSPSLGRAGFDPQAMEASSVIATKVYLIIFES